MNEEQTYKGIPIAWIQIMYSYLQEHGAVDDDGMSDYMRGFKDGINCFYQQIEKGIEEAVDQYAKDGTWRGVMVEWRTSFKGTEVEQ